MKTKKGLKRLIKIEALMADVTERFSNSSLEIQEALRDARSAFARVKEAVTLVASSAAKDSAPVRTTAEKTAPAPVPATAPVAKPAKRKLSAAGKKAIQEGVRRRMAKSREATANTDQPKGKAAPVRKKAAPKKAAPKKAKRNFSAAQREAAAERMRLRWAAKKKAEVNTAPKNSAGKAKKTAKTT
jgi:hypothetical protein